MGEGGFCFLVIVAIVRYLNKPAPTTPGDAIEIDGIGQICRGGFMSSIQLTP